MIEFLMNPDTVLSTFYLDDKQFPYIIFCRFIFMLNPNFIMACQNTAIGIVSMSRLNQASFMWTKPEYFSWDDMFVVRKGSLMVG